MEKRFLVIGLGSMGKRRVRCLQALNKKNIAGYDFRDDRAKEANDKYGIEGFTSFDKAIEQFKPTAFVISTSPESHMHYAFYALEHGISCFIEASVTEAEKIKKLSTLAADSKSIFCPSTTMRYFEGPQTIRKWINKKRIGKVLNINYQTGQYLPDWHPWEPIETFYVSKRETGAAREIVPFELTWINEIFGEPTPLACSKRKLTDMNADIDDIYHCLLQYPNDVLANITVEVISRPQHTREMRILGSDGLIIYSADENCVRIKSTDMKDWEIVSFAKGTVEKEYINPEEPYISEIREMSDAIEKDQPSLYPNTLINDYNTLQVLYKLEDLSKEVEV